MTDALRPVCYSLALLAIITTARASRAADFDRQIRPLLSDHCFQCHGPDQEQRQAELRLDTREFLEGDARIVIPGAAATSELYRRITATDPDERMPPASSKRQLTAEQIALIRDWIEAGANWQEHWSFVAPQRPAITPQPHDRNAIDSFISKQLDRNGLSANPEADRRTLIRRLTIDLTGLPASPEEVSAYLNDPAPNAYERVVDRLLASPRYGERMASVWLDAARFADTSGYQNDGPRSMWRWRDWVIDAYNLGLPFDQFTIEQIAGDLLAAPTQEQRIATGFNRNHRGNSEGGIIPEEYQVEYVVDRVETTSTVWLALTLGCARCHDHKFDPITQREFYQVYAFFNSIPEHGRAIKEGNSPPYIAAPTGAQRDQVLRIDNELAAEKARFEALFSDHQSGEDPLPAADQPTVSDELQARFSMDASQPIAAGEADSPPRFRGGVPPHVPGRLAEAVSFDGNSYVDAGGVGDFGYLDRFTVMAWINPAAAGGTVLSKMTDEVQEKGYYVQVLDGRVHVNLIVRWLDDSIRVATTEKLAANQWSHLAVSYDGSRRADGIQVYVDGKPMELRVDLDAINQSFALSNEPFRIGGGGGSTGRFRGAIDEVRIYGECLSGSDILIAATGDDVSQLCQIPAGERTAGQRAKLERHYLEHQADGELRESYRDLVRLRRERAELLRSLPTVMVMQEMEQPRPTYVLSRGVYDKPGERVSADVPARLPKLDVENRLANRLDLARWIVSDENPLTARVAVNRYWQLVFGRGLVNTTEDFGIQGERPTHPDLLDWLAVEFRDSGWKVKSLHRQLVTSAAYRRSSSISADSLAKDPENHWLSRGARYRLPAEVVRDQALHASGLLVEQLGGASVRPYQPPDLWLDIASDKNYQQDSGAGLYRRSLYTYWKRTVSPPAMATFDASTRETCRVRVSRTNTPLQALTLMNDVTFVEAARMLAERVMTAHSQPDARLRLAFRWVLARPPTKSETEILVDGFRTHLKLYEHHPDKSQQLVRVGDYPADQALDAAELAAYTAITSMLLNLDEAVTKQ
jgi:mono/diheme cytochrome c family protein